MHRWPGINGVTLAGDSWGPADGPLVLLLHGGGQTRHAWRGAGQALGDAGYRAVAFDARAHGDSDWAGEGNYGHGRMTEDLVALAARLGDTRPVLVGASMGGLASLEAVGDDLIDATALVLVDIAPRMEMDSASPGSSSSWTPSRTASRRWRRWPTRSPPTSRTGPDRPTCPVSPRTCAYGRTVASAGTGIRRGGSGTPIVRRCTSGMPRPPWLSLPTLLVRGGLSDVLSEDGAESFLELVPHSEYVNVKEASHMVAGDRNDVFAGAVIEFLHRVGTARRQARPATAPAPPPPRGPADAGVRHPVERPDGYTAAAFWRASISSQAKPASRSTSSVCWPSWGTSAETCTGVSDMRIGEPTVVCSTPLASMTLVM